jgi:flagellar basal body-associated protein FliL
MNAPQPKKSMRWMILIAIVIIASLVGIIASYVIQQRQANPVSPATSPEKTETPVTTQAQPAVEPVVEDSANNVLLTAPLPATDALAKEEVDRLQDQYSQLAEQKELLQQQIADSNKLIEMKEKYLADLQAKLQDTSA